MSGKTKPWLVLQKSPPTGCLCVEGVARSLPNSNQWDHKGLSCRPLDRESMFLLRSSKATFFLLGKHMGPKSHTRERSWASLPRTQCLREGHTRTSRLLLGPHAWIVSGALSPPLFCSHWAEASFLLAYMP